MSSRIEQFYEALLNGGEVPEPQSRIEKQLHALLYGGDAPAPQTRAEAYLAAIREKGGTGGGMLVSNDDQVVSTTKWGKIVEFGVRFPVATSINERAFYECTGLKAVEASAATSIGDSAFFGCHSLETADFPAATSIGDSAFYGCTVLSALILRTTDTVCAVDVTAMVDTKIVDEYGAPTGEGFVYLPAVMFEAYRSAYEPVFAEMGVDGLFDLLFRKIEDYPEICG